MTDRYTETDVQTDINRQTDRRTQIDKQMRQSDTQAYGPTGLDRQADRQILINIDRQTEISFQLSDCKKNKSPIVRNDFKSVSKYVIF